MRLILSFLFFIWATSVQAQEKEIWVDDQALKLDSFSLETRGQSSTTNLAPSKLMGRPDGDWEERYRFRYYFVLDFKNKLAWKGSPEVLVENLVVRYKSELLKNSALTAPQINRKASRFRQDVLDKLKQKKTSRGPSDVLHAASEIAGKAEFKGAALITAIIAYGWEVGAWSYDQFAEERRRLEREGQLSKNQSEALKRADELAQRIHDVLYGNEEIGIEPDPRAKKVFNEEGSLPTILGRDLESEPSVNLFSSNLPLALLEGQAVLLDFMAKVERGVDVKAEQIKKLSLFLSQALSLQMSDVEQKFKEYIESVEDSLKTHASRESKKVRDLIRKEAQVIRTHAELLNITEIQASALFARAGAQLVIDYQKKMALQEKLLKEKQWLFETRLQIVANTATLVSFFMSKNDPKGAQNFQAVTATAIQVIRALDAYNSAVSSATSFNASQIASIGASALTLNIFMAFVSLGTTLMYEETSEAEAVVNAIGQMIQALSEQIAKGFQNLSDQLADHRREFRAVQRWLRNLSGLTLRRIYQNRNYLISLYTQTDEIKRQLYGLKQNIFEVEFAKSLFSRSVLFESCLDARYKYLPEASPPGVVGSLNECYNRPLSEANQGSLEESILSSFHSFKENPRALWRAEHRKSLAFYLQVLAQWVREFNDLNGYVQSDVIRHPFLLLEQIRYFRDFAWIKWFQVFHSIEFYHRYHRTNYDWRMDQIFGSTDLNEMYVQAIATADFLNLLQSSDPSLSMWRKILQRNLQNFREFFTQVQNLIQQLQQDLVQAEEHDLINFIIETKSLYEHRKVTLSGNQHELCASDLPQGLISGQVYAFLPVELLALNRIGLVNLEFCINNFRWSDRGKTEFYLSQPFKSHSRDKHRIAQKVAKFDTDDRRSAVLYDAHVVVESSDQSWFKDMKLDLGTFETENFFDHYKTYHHHTLDREFKRKARKKRRDEDAVNTKAWVKYWFGFNTPHTLKTEIIKSIQQGSNSYDSVIHPHEFLRPGAYRVKDSRYLVMQKEQGDFFRHLLKKHFEGEQEALLARIKTLSQNKGDVANAPSVLVQKVRMAKEILDRELFFTGLLLQIAFALPDNSGDQIAAFISRALNPSFIDQMLRAVVGGQWNSVNRDWVMTLRSLEQAIVQKVSETGIHPLANLLRSESNQMKANFEALQEGLALRGQLSFSNLTEQ